MIDAAVLVKTLAGFDYSAMYQDNLEDLPDIKVVSEEEIEKLSKKFMGENSEAYEELATWRPEK